jgi:hypothetical protein
LGLVLSGPHFCMARITGNFWAASLATFMDGFGPGSQWPTLLQYGPTDFGSLRQVGPEWFERALGLVIFTPREISIKNHALF